MEGRPQFWACLLLISEWGIESIPFLSIAGHSTEIGANHCSEAGATLLLYTADCCPEAGACLSHEERATGAFPCPEHRRQLLWDSGLLVIVFLSEQLDLFPMHESEHGRPLLWDRPTATLRQELFILCKCQAFCLLYTNDHCTVTGGCLCHVSAGNFVFCMQKTTALRQGAVYIMWMRGWSDLYFVHSRLPL